MRCLILVLLFFASPCLAQENLQVLDEGEARKVVYDHLLAQARKHFDSRRQEVAQLKTADDIRKRQAILRAKFLAALGGFPEKTPLNPQVVGTLQGDGFRVEK